MILQTEVAIDKIKISHFFGEVKIMVHDKSYFDISSKKEKDKDFLEIESVDNTIFIKSNMDMEMESPSIVVKVPYNHVKNIEINGASEMEIDAISNALAIASSGKFNLLLKNICNLSVHSIGELNGKISNISDFNLCTSGKSKLEVKSGYVNSLKCSLNGINDIIVKSNVHVLELDMLGEGEFLVKGEIDIKSISNTDLCNISLKK